MNRDSLNNYIQARFIAWYPRLAEPRVGLTSTAAPQLQQIINDRYPRLAELLTIKTWVTVSYHDIGDTFAD